MRRVSQKAKRSGKWGNSHLSLKSKPWLYGTHMYCTSHPCHVCLCNSYFSPPKFGKHHVIFSLKCMTAYICRPPPPPSSSSHIFHTSIYTKTEIDTKQQHHPSLPKNYGAAKSSFSNSFHDFNDTCFEWIKYGLRMISCARYQNIYRHTHTPNVCTYRCVSGLLYHCMFVHSNTERNEKFVGCHFSVCTHKNIPFYFISRGENVLQRDFMKILLTLIPMHSIKFINVCFTKR